MSWQLNLLECKRLADKTRFEPPGFREFKETPTVIGFSGAAGEISMNPRSRREIRVVPHQLPLDNANRAYGSGNRASGGEKAQGCHGEGHGVKARPGCPRTQGIGAEPSHSQSHDKRRGVLDRLEGYSYPRSRSPPLKS